MKDTFLRLTAFGCICAGLSILGAGRWQAWLGLYFLGAGIILTNTIRLSSGRS